MNTSDDKKLNTEEEKKKLTDILSDKGEIPVLHIHHDDEDGSMYPLAKGSQKVDEKGNAVFTFPGQDDKGYSRAQTEYVILRFGADVFLKTKASKSHKQWVSDMYKNPIVPINTFNSSSANLAA